jgi:C4-dicarboxylate transporter, DctM subunit
MGWIMIHTTLRPELVPESERAMRHMPFSARLAALRQLAPALFLIVCVLGSMYGGLATPTEAAAVGTLGAIVVSAWQRELSWRVMREIALGAVQTCSMMGLIILGATILGNIVAVLGIPDYVAKTVSGWNLSPFMLIMALLLLYIVLGTALEGFSMIATTLPVVLPLVTAAGFDKVWFGIFIVVVVEMAQLTPPVAFNFNVIQAMTGHSTSYLTWVTLPYMIIMALFVVLLVVFPGIVSFLPNLLLG